MHHSDIQKTTDRTQHFKPKNPHNSSQFEKHSELNKCILCGNISFIKFEKYS